LGGRGNGKSEGDNNTSLFLARENKKAPMIPFEPDFRAPVEFKPMKLDEKRKAWWK
jgi:hypothetical protein